MLKKRRQIRKVIIKPMFTSCPFCGSKTNPDYKDYEGLLKYLSERARILTKERSGICSKHQRRLSAEVKRARFLGLAPFIPKVLE